MDEKAIRAMLDSLTSDIKALDETS